LTTVTIVHQQRNAAPGEAAMNGMHARLHDLMVDHGRTLLSHIEGIRNGDADAIHDARVATRRIRAVLSVIDGDPRVAYDAFEEQIHGLGRALGRVRDLDIIVELADLKSADAASPGAASLSHSIRLERHDARRKLIKLLESTPLHALIPAATRGVRLWWAAKSDSDRKLRQGLRTQSEQLNDAVAHATGVYFPNRVHQVRVHAKRLRYLAEVASHAGWKTDRAIKTLSRAQTLLGDLHDREVLMQRFDRTTGDDGLGAVVMQLATERDGLFKKYLGIRDALREAAESIHDATRSRSLNWPLMAASVAVPSALLAGFLAADYRAERRKAS
jgi:CHAD domain-containing protein